MSAPTGEPSGATAPRHRAGIFAPAAYLACSWCWCIGMYLPVYLAKDFGALSFIVFAIPNMIGAGAIGFIFRSSADVRTFARAHHGALVAFVFATILFQIVFLTGFMPSGFMWLDVGIGAVTIITALVVGRSTRPRATRIAVGVWILSLGLFLAAALTAPAGAYTTLPPVRATFGLADLAMGAPAIFMGFLLCPMLDGTFLATREFHGPATARIFMLAFGLLFPALILLTLFYGARILRDDTINFYTYAHFAVQCGFTIGVQWWALRWLRTIRAEKPAPPTPPRPGRDTDPVRVRAGRILLGLVGVAFGAALFAQNFGISARPDITPQRFAYDLMLSLYGLVFPAYLMAIVVPPALGRCASLGAFIGVLVVAGTLYWLGSMEHKFWAVPVGVAAALAAPAFCPRDEEKNRKIA